MIIIVLGRKQACQDAATT